MEKYWYNEYIRIPFLELGRTREGIDCWGVVVLAFWEQLDIVLPSLNYYSNTKDKEVLPKIIKEESAAHWVKIEPGNERAFDVIVFRICGIPMHVGLVARPGYMIHCEQGGYGAGVEYRTDPKWCNRIEGFYRYAEGTNCPVAVPSSP